MLTRVWPLVEVDDLSALHPSVAPEDDLSAIQDHPLVNDSSAADIEPAAASMHERKQRTKDHEAQPHPVVKSEFKNDSIIAESIAMPHNSAEAAIIRQDDALPAKVELELSERADHDAAIETKYQESQHPKQAVESPELSHLIHSITPRPLVGSEEKEAELDAPYQPSFGRVLAGVSLVGMLAPAGSILLGVMARNLMA